MDPDHYCGHSLSVSDVVEVSDCPYVKSGFYFCDSIGFKQVAFDPSGIQPSPRYAAYLAKPEFISIDARLGINLKVTREEIEVLMKQDQAAQDLLVKLVQSDRCCMCGDTYFPEPWNEDTLGAELNFDLPAAPLSAREPEKKPNLNDKIQSSTPAPGKAPGPGLGDDHDR